MTEPTRQTIDTRRAKIAAGTRAFHKSALPRAKMDPDKAPIRILGFDEHGRKIYSRPIPYECAVRPVMREHNGRIQVSLKLTARAPRWRGGRRL